MTRWFTSDIHGCHPFVAALRGYTKPKYAHMTPQELREYANDNGIDFKELVDWRKHDEDIVRNFNEVMSVEDELYVLGDAYSGGRTSLRMALQSWGRFKVPRSRRHLILGNHDPITSTGNHHDLNELLTVFGDISRNETIVIDNHNVILSHFQFHFQDGMVQNDGSLSTNAQTAKYEKYAVIDDGSTLLLHGHTHAKTPFEFGNPREMNVGVDAWGMKPVSEYMVIENLIKPNYGMFDAF